MFAVVSGIEFTNKKTIVIQAIIIKKVLAVFRQDHNIPFIQF